MNIKTQTVEAKADGANGSISGYAATWTREPDSYGDVIAKGAFAESLAAIAESGKAIPLLWNHDSYNLGSYIGTVKALEEDDHGLYFEADFDATDEAQRARELAMDGRLAKFSFAYDIQDQGTVELEDGREANELRKLNIHEVSLVMYPANPDTSVVEVKGAPGADTKAGRRNSKADEDALRELAQHAAAIQSIVDGLIGDEPEDPDGQEGKAKAGDAKANGEEPTGQPGGAEVKDAEVEVLLEKASNILKGGF